MAITSEPNVYVFQSSETDFAGLITRAKTEFELFTICDRLANLQKLPYFAVMKLPSDIEQTLASISLMSNWPNFLIAEYDRNRLLEKSSMFKHLKQSTEPYFLDLEGDNLSDLADEDYLTASIFEIHNIKYGAFFSVHLADGEIGTVSFCGSSSVSDDKQIKELHYLSGLIFSRLDAIRRDDDETKNHNLNKREVDCLQLVSRGKSNAEISKICNITEMTVRHVISSAVSKLDANSQAHAIGKLLRMKVID